MSLPIPAKSWLISANNSSLTNGVTNTDSIGRKRDVADFFGVLATELITLGALTVVGSSDGVSNVSPPTLGPTNYWLPGSTNFRDAVFQALGPSYIGVQPCPWLILQLGAGQLAFTLGHNDPITGRNFVVYWSPAGLFTAPADPNHRPEASDEQKLVTCQCSDNNLFNQDSLGIINSSNAYASYTQQIHVVLANDLSGFWAVSYRAFQPAFFMWFGGLSNPITTTTGTGNDWATAKAMFVSGNLTQRQIVGPYGDTLGYQMRSTYEPNGIRAVMPCGPNFDGNGNPTTYQGVAYNPLIFNAYVDLDTGLLPIFPIGAYSPTWKGIKGILTDVWWGASNGNANVYPSSGPIEFVQINDVIVPWAISAPAPLFT